MRNSRSAWAVAISTAGAVVFGVMASPAHAQATPITIPNAGFETRGDYDPFPEGTDKYNQYVQESWRHLELSHNGGPLRIWNPGVCEVDETPQGVLDVGFGGDAPEGDYVVLVRSRYNDATNVPEDPQIRDFEAAVQLLVDTFDPTKTYTLTAEVGRLVGSENYTPDWYGYALQLAVGGTNVDGAQYQGKVIGGTVIAEDSNSVEVEEDEFETATVTYTPDPAHADLAGLPLQIRLVALEDPDDHSLTSWVAFDDVQLTVEESGEPETMFFRGDGNNDGRTDLSDAVFVLNYLFLGGDTPACLAAANTNADANVDIADPTYLLNHLFIGGPPPVDPFGGCGSSDLETDETLGCEESSCP
jgi:hypothetical protein